MKSNGKIIVGLVLIVCLWVTIVGLIITLFIKLADASNSINVGAEVVNTQLKVAEPHGDYHFRATHQRDLLDE